VPDHGSKRQGDCGGFESHVYQEGFNSPPFTTHQVSRCFKGWPANMGEGAAIPSPDISRQGPSALHDAVKQGTVGRPILVCFCPSTTDGSESTMIKLYRIIWRDGRFDYYASKLNTVDSPPRVRWSTKTDDPYPDWFTKEELVKVLEFYNDQELEVESAYVESAK